MNETFICVRRYRCILAAVSLGSLLGLAVSQPILSSSKSGKRYHLEAYFTGTVLERLLANFSMTKVAN